MDETTFDPDLIHAIFKLVWSRRALEREKNDCIEALEGEVRISLAFLIQWAIGLYSTRNAVTAGMSKKSRPTSANANALKLSCELLRLFVTEAVQRSATIAEAEGVGKIEATHLERILPQLLLDF
ncbi:protein MHF2 homolog isoform X1 [Diospyros lotus]|uniref:protein MHF2 homolog isoform X1 n=1 Tax=Diospyros lotus TaxID=55363 RepID=UPI002253DF85|nr:protein MHF2 homolog isoform X1 [Diospyros lotus]XP_052182529.1 protein MHF2 homolog isoform X1 [Diospyros lotus]XP_052182530.1 protein MHF2 homolog isoform X1 [Diospyros lotus]